MALLTEDFFRRISQEKITAGVNFSKKASQVLLESANESHSKKSFDIFLSHSFDDAEIIHGIYEYLSREFSVYVDWIVDGDLDRRNITEETTKLIKTRIQNSKVLLYATSEHTTTSKWMPWECGLKEGIDGKIAILPLVNSRSTSLYAGHDFLNVYPYIIKAKPKGKDEEILWIKSKDDSYKPLKNWVQF